MTKAPRQEGILNPGRRLGLQRCERKGEEGNVQSETPEDGQVENDEVSFLDGCVGSGAGQGEIYQVAIDETAEFTKG